MAISHIKSNTIADFTGTVTVFNSVGSTQTANATDLVRPIDWNSVHNFFQTISGNTAGSSTMSGTNLVWAGGNNITLSNNTAAGAATISIHGVAAQSVVPGIQSIQVSNTTYTTGNVIFSNANGLSFGSSAGGAVTASYTVPSTAGLLSNINISAGTTSTNASNFTFSNSNGLAFGLSSGAGAGVITGSYTVPTVTQYFSNTATTFNGANISGSITNNTAGLQLSLSVAAQTNQTVGVYGSSQTTGSASSGTHDARSMSFIGAGIISIGNHSTSAGGTTTGIVISATQSNQNITAGNGGFAFQTLSFSNANNFSFGTSAGSAITGSFSQSVQPVAASASNGSFNFSTLNFSNANNVTFGTSAGGIVTASVAAPGAAAENNWFNLLGANTAGNTTASGSTIGLSGLGVTLSGTNGSVIVVSGGGGGAGYTQTWYAPELYGNTMTTAHANGTVYLRAFELNGAMDMDKYLFQQSFASSQTTGRITASVSAGNASSGTATWGQSGTALLFSRVNTNETNASYNSIVTFDSKTYSMSAGYSVSVSWSTNVSSATASWTTSAAVGFLNNIDSAGAFTTSSTGTSGSSTFSSTSTNANSISSTYIMSFPYAHLSGIRPLWIPGSGTNLPSNEYWIGLIQSTNTGSTNYSFQNIAMMTSPGMLYFTASSNNSYLEIGNSAVISSSNWRLGFGSYSASSNTTANIPLSAITSMSSNASMYFALDGHTK